MGIISSFKNLHKGVKCIRILGQIRFWVERCESSYKAGEDEDRLYQRRFGVYIAHIEGLFEQLKKLDCLSSDEYHFLANGLNEWLMGKRQYTKQW